MKWKDIIQILSSSKMIEPRDPREDSDIEICHNYIFTQFLLITSFELLL